MKPDEFCQHWNQKTTFYPSPQYLIDKIQVQKPTQVVATDQTIQVGAPLKTVYYWEKKK